MPFLREVLFDADDQVWKAAMDGLVAQATPEAMDALTSGRARRFKKARDEALFSSWLDEAIEQAAARGSSNPKGDDSHRRGQTTPPDLKNVHSMTI